MKKTKKKNKNPKTQDKKETQKDYIFWILLIIIIISGLHFRTTNYAEEGIRNDAPTALAGGLLWFYPHDFYPGLMQYQPPVGHYLLAKGCMLSGEDFSNVSKVSPYFIPTIAAMIGKPYAAAENYCFIPVYLASILVFLGFTIFSIMLLGKKESLFAIAFIAYNPTILSMGRNMFIWSFVWLFSIYGLIFLWKYYDSKKGSKKELIYTVITASLFGIALATKFTLALFFIFSIFIIIEKYKNNLNFKKGNAKIPLPLIKTLTIFIIIFTIVTMIPYQLNPKNFIDVYNAQTTAFSQDAGLKPGLGTINALKQFSFNMTAIDTIILLYSIFILYSLLKKPGKNTREKFILYNILLFIIGTTLFTAQIGGTRAVPYFFTIPILMALTFSDKEYSIYRKLKISTNKTQAITYTIIIIYIILNIATLIPKTPYYELRTNPILCISGTSPSCNPIPYPTYKKISIELKQLLNENETYYMYPESADIYMHIKHESYYNTWNIKEAIQRQKNDKATLEEIIQTYNYFAEQNKEKPIRYIVLGKTDYKDPLAKYMIENIQPVKTVTVKNIEISYIYDLKTLETQ